MYLHLWADQLMYLEEWVSRSRTYTASMNCRPITIDQAVSLLVGDMIEMHRAGDGKE